MHKPDYIKDSYRTIVKYIVYIYKNIIYSVYIGMYTAMDLNVHRYWYI